MLYGDGDALGVKWVEGGTGHWSWIQHRGDGQRLPPGKRAGVWFQKGSLVFDLLPRLCGGRPGCGVSTPPTSTL